MHLLTPAVRSHLWRLVRMPAFASLAAVIVVPLIRAAEVRFPAIGLIMAVLEIIVRTISPTVPAPPPVVPGSRTAPPPG
jgi:hypothetical protein